MEEKLELERVSDIIERALDSYYALLKLEWTHSMKMPIDEFILRSKGAFEFTYHLRELLNKDKIYH